MYDGYLQFGGVEVFNRARAAAYLKALAPQVQVKIEDAVLRTGLGHSPYTTPSRDNAPWYRGKRTSAARFLGLYPGKVIGAEDSTRVLEVTELHGDGAVMTSPRHGSREIRYVTSAFALDEEAMEEGMAWLRDIMANDGCSDADWGCTGNTVKMFAALPKDRVTAYNLARAFHRVEATDAPRVTKKWRTSKGLLIWQVEFILTAGVPWAFTSLAQVATLAMDTGVNFQDPAGENCAAGSSAYDDFVTDPYFTAISRPPKPPTILPPNVLDISSWRRKTATIPQVHSQRWGRVVPVVNILTENAVQYVRLRFYRSSAGLSGCDFDGEILVSYIPSTAVLTLDGIKREARLKLSDGRTVPAGHLLFGSDGRPFIWPTLGCQNTYTMTADIMPGQGGVVVTLDTAVRE
ncbi:minor tail protein [Arthrobacter phage BruhMoment]|nr:minor tail protein [Arthrobacter phage BruhMoment]